MVRQSFFQYSHDDDIKTQFQILSDKIEKINQIDYFKHKLNELTEKTYRG